MTHSRNPLFGYALGAVLGLMMVLPARAWGPQGHALIADLAVAHLDRPARTAVSRLLTTEDDQHLDKIASWADAIRSQRPETGSWHYVDIPLRAAGYRANRDCSRGACAVAQIVRFASILGDCGQSDRARLDALKFLVHFVGDIQQPLHAENHDDHGGNDVRLVYFGRSTNLHAIWDSGILDRALGLHVGRHYSIERDATLRAARQLDRNITPVERRRWRQDVRSGDIKTAAIRWANQSHRIARRVAYGNLPARSRPAWSGIYQDKSWPVVRRQIQRGGVRLAAILNAVLSR